MARYIKGTGNEKKLCSWRCVHCNCENTGVAVISVTAQQSYGVIGTTRSKAEVNVKNVINDETAKRARTVNEKHVIPEGVVINGTCASCGKRQPWSISNKYTLPRLIGGLILGILAAVLLYPFLSKIDNGDIYSFFLSFLTIVLVAWGVDKGSGRLLQLIASRKMSVYGAEYFPKLLDLPGESGDVSPDSLGHRL